MSEQTNNMSNCVALQCALFSLGLILVIVLLYNWYNTYASNYVMPCQRFRQPENFASKATKAPSQKMLNEQTLHEGFLNYQSQNADLDFQSSYNVANYDDAPEFDPARESLEQSVFDSHKEFVDDSYISSQGPSSTNTERDDDSGPVKRWGLRRVDYESVQSGDDARQVSSEYAEQVRQNVGSYVI